MQRTATRLIGGLLLLAVAAAAVADSALGTDDDRQDVYRGQPDQHQSDRRGWGSDGARPQPPARNRAYQRPLGTQHDDYRGQYEDDHTQGHGDAYGRQYDRGSDRYGHDARRAADAVRRDQRGRVLSSEPFDDRGYRVRVLTPDGYVRERYVDPHDDDRHHRRRRD